MAIVAIARGTLSGGRALAELAARELGYPCVSRESIVNSAEWYGVPEGAPGTSPGSGTPWERLANERLAYQEAFRAAVCERITRGNLVYHGHAAHLLLPGVPMLRVRAVADMPYRIAAVMRDTGLAREEAAAYVTRIDNERMEWVRYLYGVEWDDPTLYDVVLNLSHLTIEGACSTVVHMAGFEEFKLDSSSLRTVENLALRGRVTAALARDARTTGGCAGVKVEVKDGVVSVSGTAPQEVAEALPAVIAAVGGVKNVKNYVEIQSGVRSE